MNISVRDSLIFAICSVFFTVSGFGQMLVLPGMPKLSNGSGECVEIYLGISSERWRVRKGDTFETSAFMPFQEQSGLKYKWIVENGNIVSGQGTPKVSIKAGGKRTPGFVNASGFVRVKLAVQPNIAELKCSVNAETSVMVGKHREINQFSEVESISLSRNEITALCSESAESSKPEHATQVKVTTKASDPENDPLVYVYVVSDGTILGTGANVVWDLSGAEAGIHRIMVGTDDGAGIKSVKSVTIKVVPCAK